MRNKRGQEVFGMSFGVIFSIFLIIALLVVAFYVISNFLEVDTCAQINSAYDGLKKEVDNAWASNGLIEDVKTLSLPKEITRVCFGNLTQDAEQASLSYQTLIRNNFSISSRYSNNVHLLPNKVGRSCSPDLSYYKLNHAKVGEFFCLQTQDGKATFKISKGSSDVLVKIMKP